MKYGSLTHGELFAGISGFGLGFARAGIKTIWHVEIDAYCQDVLRRHYPDTLLLSDVRECGVANLPRVDIISFGSPCQDLSVAGNRKGLIDGERSSLFFEAIRIVDELKPTWVVFENVPGLLSSNDSDDIQIVLDSLAQIGYTVDGDILDAQFFGVPQRRKRVILLCVRLDALLSKKTNLSRQISADLVVQILLDIWGALPQALSLVPLHSDSERPTGRCAISLKKKMSLLRQTRGNSVLQKWDVGLTDLLVQFMDEVNIILVLPFLELQNRTSRAMDTSALEQRYLVDTNGEMNIPTWLSRLSGDILIQARESTTSILTRQTIDWTIYIFSQVILNTVTHMVRSLDWSVNCWSVAQSLSTLLKENMNYARQANSSLFIEDGLRDCWGDYLNTAPRVKESFERHLGNARELVEAQSNQDTARLAELYPKILFESKSGAWDPPPSREAGQRVAGNAEISTCQCTGHGWWNESSVGQSVRAENQTESNLIAYGGNNTQGPIDVATACNAHGSRRYDFESETFVVNDGKADTQCVAWHENQGGEFTIDPAGIAKALKAGASHSYQGVGVRRLTPTECERLQGFPDGHTAGQSDSARYKQLGNAVAVPCAEWIGKRIVRLK